MKNKPHFRPAEIAGVLMCAAGLGLITHLGISETVSDQTTIKAHRIAEMTTTTTLSSASTQLHSTGTSLAITTSKTAATESQTTAVITQTSPTEAVNFPLNLNTADTTELTALPGIGEVLAQRIIAYRTTVGGFLNREQLLEVEGIGESRLMQIYDLIYLDNEQYPEQEPMTEAAVEPMQNIPEPSVSEPSPETLEPIDLNTADMETLLKLPDMTEALAAEILALREEIGCFSSPYELLYAEGMTAPYFDQIRDFVQIT